MSDIVAGNIEASSDIVGNSEVSSGSSSINEIDVNFFDLQFLKNKFCPRGMKTHSRAPTHEYRASIAKVEEWFLLTREAQDVKLEEWRKMSRSQKQKFTVMIPNQENNKRRPSRDVAATRSGQSQDKRIKKAEPVAKKITSLASSEAERKKAQEKYRAEPKARRTKKCNARAVHPGANCTGTTPRFSVSYSSRVRPTDASPAVDGSNLIGAHNVSALFDRAVDKQRQLVMKEFATLVRMVRPEFKYSDGMPRHTSYLVSFNEVHRTKKGRPLKNPKKRDKTEVLFLGASSHEDRLTKIGNLAGQLKAISKKPNSVELTCLLDNDLTDIRDEVNSHTQKQLAAVSESSFKAVDFHSTENVVAADTVHLPSPHTSSQGSSKRRRRTR
jgi:hypothetical protein